jgi:CRP-like cAMP-binding protein
VLLPPFRGKRAMLAASSPRHRNRLLAALAPADLRLLQPHLEPLTLKLRHNMERPNKRIDDVFFIDAGIASVVAVQSEGERVEVGLVGREGMTGTAVVLGGNQSPHETYVQVAGNGRRIAAAELCRAMKASESLHGLLLKYVQAFMVQTAHTAIANARAKLDERLSRWILMAHDRIAGDTLALTHEFLALMLGVRRAGVTEALQSLTRQKLIEIHRGEIVVLDRQGIERRAGSSYGSPEAEYRRLIG